ncbi:integrase, partial [Escherichia coli]
RFAIEISYLFAARLGDVLDLKWLDIMDKGIYIEQNKTGNKQIKEWSPRLRTAIQLARNVSSCTCEYVIYTTKGGKVI